MSDYSREQLESIFDEKSERLHLLMEQLPQMEEKSLRLGQVRAAEALVEVAEAYQRLQSERDFMKSEEKQYRDAGKLGMSAYIQNQMGYRQGPLNEAEATYRQVLQNSGFQSVQEARQWLEGEESRAQLEAEITDFQTEYCQLLEECNRLDEQLSTEEF